MEELDALRLVVHVENRPAGPDAAGKFQKAEARALGAAEDMAQSMKGDFRGSIVNSAAQAAYPICTLTWLIVPSQITDERKRKATRQFLDWAYKSGQRIANSMDYDELHPPLLDRVREQVGAIH